MLKNYLPFNEARQYMHNINLKNTREWKKWSKGTLPEKDKRPKFIPSNPDIIYKFKGWKSWSDWIGTDKKIEYLPFEEARKYVRNLNLKNLEEWRKYYQNKIDGLIKPENIPWNPQDIYKNEWKSTRDWIGTEWIEFEEARLFIRNLNLSGQNEWKLYSKGELEGYEPKPQNIPSDPKRVYSNEWIDLGDWLGTERKRTGSTQSIDDTWLSYQEAKEFIHSLKLNGYSQWKAYISNSIANLHHKPRNIPKAPDYVYKEDGWGGWDDWLGSHTSENNIILQKEPIHNQNIILSINIEKEFLILKKEYRQYLKIVELIDNLFYLNKKISIIETALDENTIDQLQTLLFSFKNFNKLTQIEKAFIGLTFLIFIVYNLKEEISYSLIWQTIINHLKAYNEQSEDVVKNFFMREQSPKPHLVEAIEYACKVFHLRDNFNGRDSEQHYIRNTILLQVGLVNKSLDNLKLWLSNYNQPIVVSQLLDKEEENYSKEFSEGWRALRRYRDNIISDIKLKSLLEKNIWFTHLNIENILKLSKQRVANNSMLIDDEELPIFYLDKIKYDDIGLKFIINAQDLYTLNLSGLRYELYIDNIYKGLLIADSNKNLILENSIEIINPKYNQIEIQVKNEDLDIVFSENILLFDFNEQIIIFDEDGNIYQNIFKKLNATKKYNILMDSDLDCNFNKESQIEYFDGFATLVTNIKKSDKCKISYDGESLFELNFSKYVEKPQWIDQLVLYSKNDNSFTINNEENFILQIFKIEEDEPLEDLPIDAKIIKWNYSGGYLDSNEIQNARAKLNLYPEMITNPKHTLFIKYKGRAFKKVIQCNFFEKNSIPRFFMIDKETQTHEVDSNTLLNFNDIEENKFYLSDFKQRETEVLFLKNKTKFYQTIKVNKVFKLNEFDGFGEDIFISEHLFNSKLNKLFNYTDTEKESYFNQKSLSKLFIKRELPSDVIFIILDKNMSWHKFNYNEIQSSIKNNTIELDYEISLGLITFKEEIIDSFYDISFLNSFSDLSNHKILMMLFLSNYPFLLKSKYISFLRKYILENTHIFFQNFYNNKNKIDDINIKLSFSKYSILLEHVCMGLTFGKEKATHILEDIIINKKADYLIETPIILFKLLSESYSQTLISYFDNMLSEVELKDERDNSFVENVILNLFNTTNIKGIEKHNLKVAIHHINGKYYLREALRRI